MNRPIVIVISLSLTLIFGIVLVFPKYQDFLILEKKIEIRETEIAKREEKFRDLQNTAKELENYQDQLAKIDFALPPDPDLPALFDFLQKAASQSGLFLKSISHSASQPSPDFEGLEETEASLVVSGSYPSFKEFISRYLEITARLIETESVSFSAVPEEGPREFELTIKVYSYAE